MNCKDLDYLYARLKETKDEAEQAVIQKRIKHLEDKLRVKSKHQPRPYVRENGVVFIDK